MKSLKIRGAELSDYTALLGFTDTFRIFVKLGRATLIPKMERITAKYLDGEFPIVFVSDGAYDERRVSSREVLFGKDFVREGIPAYDPKKSFYGVTEDGTVYFRSPSVMLYSYLWDLFLAEFVPLGEVPAGTYREIPDLDIAQLEKEGYRQVFADDFDGDELDGNAWALRHVGGENGGFNSASQVKTADGKLVITAEYAESGEFGPGWYAADLKLNKKYCRGYFESRIRCSETHAREGGDFWSAFWIQGDAPYDPEQAKGGIGPGGCEIDIMEDWGRDYMSSCFFTAGVEGVEGLSAELFEVRDLGNDYAKEYHTFGLSWDEDLYRVYLDGMLYAATDHALGTSRVPETVCLSVCIPGPAVTLDRGTKRAMYVDYVKIWQK